MYKDNQAVEYDALEPYPGHFHHYLPWLRWTPSSSLMLQEAEQNIVKFLQTPSEGFYVNIGLVNGSPCKIWTRMFSHSRTDSSLAPIVLIHGMGAGSALWGLNIDHLCQNQSRKVFTIDLPGFARSSRCNLSSKSEITETQYLLCLDQWRKALEFEKIILVGHSFGGYLSCCYSLTYPENLERVILVDPWGMTEKPTDLVERYEITFGRRMLFRIIKQFNPLSFLRFSGPFGPRMLPRFRPDLVQKFTNLVGEENNSLIPNYLYHCNAHHPAGEAAFSRLCDDFAWAKVPLLRRLPELENNLKVTIVYGEDSWVDPKLSKTILEKAGVKNIDRFDIIMIPNARHHVYADQYSMFNSVMVETVKSAN